RRYPRVALGDPRQQADAPHALVRLRTRGPRPRGRAAEQRDDVATFPLMEMHPPPPAERRLSHYSVAVSAGSARHLATALQGSPNVTDRSRTVSRPAQAKCSASA